MNDEKLYETAMLSLFELPEQYMSLQDLRMRDILLELLPMYYEGENPEKVAVSLLTGQGPEEVTEYAADPEETARLLKAVEDSQTDEEWSRAMQDLGWYCLEALEPVWTEELLQ